MLLTKALEDPLAYLPHTTVHDYSSGETIYDQYEPSTSIYLIVAGKVKLIRVSDKGQTVMDIYQTDELFGESALLGPPPRRKEMAVAVEDIKLMAWSRDQIEEVIARRPRLGTALVQFIVQRSESFLQRIQSFSLGTTDRRLAEALLHFSERIGHETEGGAVEMIALTHELLAQYISTTREQVTLLMNQFRHDGYLRYSRKGILLRPDMMRQWLRSSLPLAA
jgi:CRP/FNR family transcriptional regulator, cyclic AMP receptor protein